MVNEDTDNFDESIAEPHWSNSERFGYFLFVVLASLISPLVCCKWAIQPVTGREDLLFDGQLWIYRNTYLFQFLNLIFFVTIGIWLWNRKGALREFWLSMMGLAVIFSGALILVGLFLVMVVINVVS